MTRTVDLVIVGLTAAGCAAAGEAARRGRRVLIVSESASDGADRPNHKCVSLLTGVAVVCIDGVNGIEAVLLRELETNRVIGINTAAVLVTVPLADGVISPAVRAHVDHAVAVHRRH